MTTSTTRRAGVTVLLAGAALMLAPVPAHADNLCRITANGVQDCYANGQEPGTGGTTPPSAPGAVPPPPPPPAASTPQLPAPAPRAPANNSVTPKTGTGYQAPAAVPAKAVPAEVSPGVVPAPSAPEATAVATPRPTATASATTEATRVSIDQASSTEAFNPTPIFIIGGVVLATALLWFIRPVRAMLARVVARKTGH